MSGIAVDRPRYAELPLVDDGRDYRHAWGVYPKGDDLGCLANITNRARVAAMSTVSEGLSIGLSLPLELPDPPLFGRERFTHTIFSPDRNTLDDRLDNFFPQGSTQWDGFKHIRAGRLGFFTGVRDVPAEPDGRLGVGNWSAAGIVGRGVLLDFSEDGMAGDCTDDGSGAAISAAALQSAGNDAGVLPGDIICIRTGWMTNYLKLDERGRDRVSRAVAWPGLEGSADVAEVLWDWGVSAVVADNPAVEVAPGSREVGSLHRRLIPLLGMPLGELFDLERLAAECSKRDRSHFLFVSIPLNLRGGVGSPGNALGIL